MNGERSVVYVTEIFPWVTQAFAAREVKALLERAEVPIVVMSFRRPAEEVAGSLGHVFQGRVSYVPAPWNWRFLTAICGQALRHPIRLVQWCVRGVLCGNLIRTRPADRARGLLDVLRGAYLASVQADAGHFHADFANHACTAAMVAADLTRVGFSFKSHSSFNPQMLSEKASRASFIALSNRFDREFYFAEEADAKFIEARVGVGAEAFVTRVTLVDERLRILSIGTLQEKKGQRYLVEAIGLLRDRGRAAECLLVGDGPLHDVLAGTIVDLGLSSVVTLQPYVPHDQVPNLLEAYDIFVLPSVVGSDGDRDGIPSVLVEAMAAGCLCISTAVSGIPELVLDRETGYLVPQRDAPAIANCIEEVVKDRARSVAMRERARAHVAEAHSLETNTHRLARALARQLEDRAPA